MTIVVAPSSLFQPIDPVTDDVYGDTAGELRGTGRNQTFIFTSDGGSAIGDAEVMLGTAIGGRDRFQVSGTGNVFGDADEIGDRARRQRRARRHVHGRSRG